MDATLTTLIGTLVGSGLTFLSVFYTNRSQKDRDILKSKENFKLEELRLKISIREKRYEEVQKNLIETCNIIGELEHLISLTKSIIDSSAKLDFKVFDQNYEKERMLLIRLHTLALIYFEEMIEDIERLAGLHNVYWGNQRQLLDTDKVSEREVHMKLREEIIIASNDKGKHIYNLRLKIRNICEISFNIEREETIYP